MTNKTILLADDDRELVAALKMRCEACGLKTIVAYDAMTALQLAHEHQPDVCCVDVEMPCGNGLAICEMLCGGDDQPSRPVIVLTGRSDEDVIRRCLEMGVFYVLKNTDTWSRLAPLLEDLLNLPMGVPSEETAERESSPQALESVAKITGKTVADTRPEALLEEFVTWLNSQVSEPSYENTKPTVMCIDDDLDFLTVLKYRLENLGFHVEQASGGMEGFAFAAGHPPDAILLDLGMPNCRGEYVLRRLKETPGTRHIPIIVLTGRRDVATRQKVTSMGADAYLTKPCEVDAIVEALQKHIDHNAVV